MDSYFIQIYKNCLSDILLKDPVQIIEITGKRFFDEITLDFSVIVRIQIIKKLVNILIRSWNPWYLL